MSARSPALFLSLTILVLALVGHECKVRHKRDVDAATAILLRRIFENYNRGGGTNGLYPKDDMSHRKLGRLPTVQPINPFNDRYYQDFRISKRGPFDGLIETLSEMAARRPPSRVKPYRFGTGRKRATGWDRLEDWE